jgi:predicted outer membrane repeat protein
MTSCTISGNSASEYGGGIYGYAEAYPAMTDCILWGNTAPNGHEIALSYSQDHPSTLTVRYSDVQGGAGEAYVEAGCTLDMDGTCIDSDPLFVSGPLGDHYLSHVATDQLSDSPCVDTGSASAVSLGLDTRTTRTDSIPDSGTVDMGYHYPLSTVPTITSIEKVGNDVTITWDAVPSVSYVVQYSADVVFGSYTEVSVGETDNWTDVGGALEQQRYYRVRGQ